MKSHKLWLITNQILSITQFEDFYHFINLIKLYQDYNKSNDNHQ